MSVYWINNGTNLQITTNGQQTAKTNIGRTTGKYYWELYTNKINASLFGIVNSSVSLTGNNFLNNSCRWYYSNAEKTPPRASYGGKVTDGDTIGLFLDLDNGILEFFKNGVSQGIAFNNLSSLGEVFPAISSGSTSGTQTITANFGSSEFTHLPKSLPTGTKSYDGSRSLVVSDKTLILSNNEYKTYNSGWQTVSSTHPLESQFLSDGIDDLSVLERKVQSLPPIKFNQSEILFQNGKLFTKTLDLNKYMDIRSMKVEVK